MEPAGRHLAVVEAAFVVTCSAVAGNAERGKAETRGGPGVAGPSLLGGPATPGAARRGCPSPRCAARICSSRARAANGHGLQPAAGDGSLSLRAWGRCSKWAVTSGQSTRPQRGRLPLTEPPGHLPPDRGGPRCPVLPEPEPPLQPASSAATCGRQGGHCRLGVRAAVPHTVKGGSSRAPLWPPEPAASGFSPPGSDERGSDPRQLLSSLRRALSLFTDRTVTGGRRGGPASPGRTRSGEPALRSPALTKLLLQTERSA